MNPQSGLDAGTAVEPKAGALIELRRIVKIYQKGTVKVTALDAVDLTIAEREFVAIMGPSGSGKSTLLHIISCMDQPTDGSYLLSGTEASRLTDEELSYIRCHKIGFVFQDFNLLPRLDALENVMMPLAYAGIHEHQSRTMAREALERVGLADRMSHHPAELSGGQQQRVAIARALVTSPQVLMADEPTGNLDTHSSDEILAVLQSLNDEGRTIVMVTHETDVARCCRRIVGLRDGRIVEDRPVGDRRILRSGGLS